MYNWIHILWKRIFLPEIFAFAAVFLSIPVSIRCTDDITSELIMRYLSIFSAIILKAILSYYFDNISGIIAIIGVSITSAVFYTIYNQIYSRYISIKLNNNIDNASGNDSKAQNRYITTLDSDI